MQKTIDLLNNTTGWASAGSITAYGVNQIPDFIAGLNNTGSLIVYIPAGSQGQTIKKTISSDLTGYNEVVLHVWSRNKWKLKNNYESSADFNYQIDFGGSAYMLPTYAGFKPAVLYIKGTGAITQIQITPLYNDEDYIIISNLLAVKDEMPADIFDGLKAQILDELNKIYNNVSNGVQDKGILLGQISSTTGDKSIYLKTGYNWLDKYSTILIDDGANSETHQIDNNDDRKFTFNTLYDGESIKHDHTLANMYMVIPVEYGLTEKEIILPGISIWGMTPEEIMRSTKLENVVDTFADDYSAYSRQSPVTFMYNITLDCDARQHELLALASIACRNVIAKQQIWVNGQKLNLFFDASPEYIEPMEAVNEIPKMVYKCKVEIREDVWLRELLVGANSADLTVNIEDSINIGG